MSFKSAESSEAREGSAAEPSSERPKDSIGRLDQRQEFWAGIGKMLLDSSPDAVLVCHRDGTLHTQNRLAEEWLGKSGAQLQDANLAEVFGPAHAHLLYRMLTRSARGRTE
jgi:PAS domain-containing protein